MKFKKVLLICSCCAIMCFASPFTAFADNEVKWNANEAIYTKLHEDNPDGNYVRTGGVNKLDNIPALDRSETQDLEAHLLDHNYVLISSPLKDITDEDVKMLNTVGFNGRPYLNDDDAVRSDYKYFRAYVYKPTLETARKHWEENGKLDIDTIWEIHTSSVVINYSCWEEKEKVGQVLGGEEINERMPAKYEEAAGFVEFNSPINAAIQLHLRDANYDYLLYIPKGKSLMKLRSDHYTIVQINSDSLEFGDEILTNKNYLVVYKQPMDSPLVVDLEAVVKRDNIEDIDITDKPDCRWGAVYEPVDIDDNGEVLVDKTKNLANTDIDVLPTKTEKEHAKTARFAKIFLLLTAAVSVVGGLIYWIRKKDSEERK